MTNEILEKIERIIRTPLPSESDINHLFTLIRKLIERLRGSDKRNFALLKFYCDWVLHSEIDKSSEGAMIIERVHAIINDHMRRNDSGQIPADLTAALSLNEVRSQLNNLLQLSEPGIGLSVDNEQWRVIIIQLVEIISHCPLRIDKSKWWLTEILDKITAKPIKDKAIVEEVAVIKISKQVFSPRAKEDELVYCIMLTLSDTTHIIAPLIIPI